MEERIVLVCQHSLHIIEQVACQGYIWKEVSHFGRDKLYGALIQQILIFVALYLSVEKPRLELLNLLTVTEPFLLRQKRGLLLQFAHLRQEGH